VANGLAKDCYDVALNDLPSKIKGLKEVSAEIKPTGKKTIIIPGDVTNEQLGKDMVDRTVKEFSLLHILPPFSASFIKDPVSEMLWHTEMVVNAGIASPEGPVVDTERTEIFFFSFLVHTFQKLMVDNLTQ